MTVSPETIARIIRVIDLTNLANDVTEQDISALCRKARDTDVAAICVHIAMVSLGRSELAGTGIRTATVLNFPTGTASVAEVMAEARRAVDAGAEELDLVVPYRDGPTAVEEMVRSVREAHADIPLKTILETGELTPENQNALARAAIAGGADMLKTSTGMVPTGATPEAAAALLHEIAQAGRPVGLKVSGGIRTAQDAAGYLAQADAAFRQPVDKRSFRIGCSGLLDVLTGGQGQGGY